MLKSIKRIMKKITTAVLALVYSLSYGQINQYKALEKFPDGTILTGYKNVKLDEKGNYQGGKYEEDLRLDYHNSMHGKLYVITVNEVSEPKKDYDYRELQPITIPNLQFFQ